MAKNNQNSQIVPMPDLPDAVQLKARLDAMKAEAERAFDFIYVELGALDIANAPANVESAENIREAIVYADNQVRGLQTLAQEAHATLAAVAAYAQAVTEQRDKALKAYQHAFEHGVLHAYECDACMQDAAVEDLANRMLESSVEEVATQEWERFNELAAEAEALHDEWVTDDAVEDQLHGLQDRKVLVGLISDSLDLESAEAYDVAQIEAERAYVAGLLGEGSDSQDSGSSGDFEDDSDTDNFDQRYDLAETA